MGIAGTNFSHSLSTRPIFSLTSLSIFCNFFIDGYICIQMYIYMYIYIQIDRQIDTQIHRYIDTQIHRQIHRQIDRQKLETARRAVQTFASRHSTQYWVARRLRLTPVQFKEVFSPPSFSLSSMHSQGTWTTSAHRNALAMEYRMYLPLITFYSRMICLFQHRTAGICSV